MSYKNEEKYHYNNKVEFKKNFTNDVFLSLSDLLVFHSHLFFEELVLALTQISINKITLDYGCGIGTKSAKFASLTNKIIGIDISEKSIEVAKERKIKNAEYFVMDCEKTEFENNKFDLVFDYGTFSSIDISKAVPEIIRIMKPNGSLIAIETYGHNPLMNIKRKINVLLGKRTAWSAQHIMRKKDWEFVSQHFESCKIKYFGTISYLFLPVVKICPEKFRDKLLNNIYTFDEYISNIMLFKKFSFKTVVILSNPIINSKET